MDSSPRPPPDGLRSDASAEFPSAPGHDPPRSLALRPAVPHPPVRRSGPSPSPSLVALQHAALPASSDGPPAHLASLITQAAPSPAFQCSSPLGDGSCPAGKQQRKKKKKKKKKNTSITSNSKAAQKTEPDPDPPRPLLPQTRASSAEPHCNPPPSQTPSPPRPQLSPLPPQPPSSSQPPRSSSPQPWTAPRPQPPLSQDAALNDLASSHGSRGSEARALRKTTSKPAKTPARKKLIRFLLPCFHLGHQDDDYRFSTAPRPAAAHSKHPPLTTSSSSPAPSPLAPKTRPAPTSRDASVLAAGAPPKKSERPSSQAKLRRRRSGSGTPRHSATPTLVPDTTTPAGAAVATSVANSGGGGVQLPHDETEGILSGAVVPPGKDVASLKKKASRRLDDPSDVETEGSSAGEGGLGVGEGGGEGEEVVEESEEEDDEEDRIVAMGGMGVPVNEEGVPQPLLAALDTRDLGRKCLVLDLDETLVHSSFKMIPQSDFIVPVEIENSVHNVFVIKRPGVDEFMRQMGSIYEVVVFTASLAKYADPVLDKLDIHRVVRHRLFRESCYNHKGNYVKDLSQLGRRIEDTIIIDNSPASYVFHPNNAVPVSSWFNDPHDTELMDLAAFLADIASVEDVRGILDSRL